MKLRLVLFSSCTLLFSSLSSLSLNAQQEREARLRVTTSLLTLAANGAKPEFGPNVLIFDPAMPSQAIQKQIDAVYSTQEHNEFGQQRNALLFLPGNYSVDVPVGFYTEVMGLGASPDATRIAGNVHADANHEHNNATTTFWRAVEGLSIKPAGGTMQWAVSQAVSLRRMHVRGDLVLHQNHGWASGGWMSDSLVDGNVDSGSQQQWISRNCDWKSWTGANWNMVFVGVVHPPEGAWPSPPYTKVAHTPVVREKPFPRHSAAGTASRAPLAYALPSCTAARAMRLPGDAPRRQTPCSSSHPSNSSSRSCARSTAAGCRSQHSRPPANPTSSPRLPSHDSGAAPGRRVRACAAATLPARPPTASCRQPALWRAPPQLSRRSSSHFCAHDSHPHARCPQSALHRATRPAPSPLCKSPPARPPNSFPAGIAARSAAVQTRCAPASNTPHRSASGWPAMASPIEDQHIGSELRLRAVRRKGRQGCRHPQPRLSLLLRGQRPGRQGREQQGTRGKQDQSQLHEDSGLRRVRSFSERQTIAVVRNSHTTIRQR